MTQLEDDFVEDCCEVCGDELDGGAKANKLCGSCADHQMNLDGEQLIYLIAAAKHVIAAWETGDLADAVRKLDAAIDRAEGRS